MSGKKQQIIEAIQKQTEPFHSTLISGLTGASTPYVTNIILEQVAIGKLIPIQDGKRVLYKINESTSQTVSISSGVPDFSVAEKFSFVKQLCNIVIQGRSPSLFITGSAGIGKTHMVLQALKDNGRLEGPDYITIKGFSSPMGLYTTLFNYRKGFTIVFDDTDSILKNDTAINILKVALDSYSTRNINWNSIAAERCNIDSCFTFDSSVIFISNKPLESIDEAIRSRTYCVNLTMTPDEIVDLFVSIADKIEPTSAIELKMEVIEYLKSIKDTITDLNIRTLIKSIRIRESCPENWQKLITYSVRG